MRKFYMTIDGRKVRLEANWNALIGFLQETGKDDLGALADLKTLRPSDLAGLMAACINEGERLEGRESSYTARTLGEVINASDVLEFVNLYSSMVSPDVPEDEGKKKD